MLKEVRDSRFQ